MHRKDSPTLELVIQNCKIYVKAVGQLAKQSARVNAIVSAEAVDILTRIKFSVEKAEEFKPLSEQFLKECLDLYIRLSQADKEVIFRALSFLEWTDKNILTLTLSMKLKSEWSTDINRLQVLQGSIEAGHTNGEVLQEWLDLLHKLTRLKLVPSSYSKSISRRISKIFLENVKKDKEARALSTNSK